MEGEAAEPKSVLPLTPPLPSVDGHHPDPQASTDSPLSVLWTLDPAPVPLPRPQCCMSRTAPPTPKAEFTC